MPEQVADGPLPEKKRKSFRRNKLSSHGLPIRVVGDVPAGMMLAKVPDDVFGDLLTAAVYDGLASPTSRYQPGSYGFHTRLIAERREVALVLQQGGLPVFSGEQLRKVRNCSPLGVRSSRWRSWPCGLIRWCPFCFAKRLYDDWKEIRQRFLDKPTFRHFRLAIVEGFAVLGEAAEHLDLGSAAGLARAEAMQVGVQRVLREYRPSLARIAAWWQHTHLHPVSERSTEVGCTWKLVAVVTRRQGAAFVPPADPRFSWRVRTVEVFDERELAKEFGAALSYPPEVLRGNVQTTARLLRLGDLAQRHWFVSGTPEAEAARAKRPGRPRKKPKPRPARKGRRGVLRQIRPPKPPAVKPVVPRQEPKQTIEAFMASANYRVIVEFFEQRKIKTTPTQLRAMLFWWYQIRFFAPTIALADFLAQVETGFRPPHDSAEPPDEWFIPAAVHNNCPFTAKTAAKHGTVPWTEEEIDDCLDTALLAVEMAREAGRTESFRTLFDTLVAERTAEKAAQPDPPAPAATAKAGKPAPAAPPTPVAGVPVVYTVAAFNGRQVRGYITDVEQTPTGSVYDIMDEFGEVWRGCPGESVEALHEPLPSQIPPGTPSVTIKVPMEEASDVAQIRARLEADDRDPLVPGTLIYSRDVKHGEFRFRMQMTLGDSGPYMYGHLVDMREQVVGRSRPRYRSAYGQYRFPLKNSAGVDEGFLIFEVVRDGGENPGDR